MGATKNTNPNRVATELSKAVRNIRQFNKTPSVKQLKDGELALNKTTSTLILRIGNDLLEFTGSKVN